MSANLQALRTLAEETGSIESLGHLLTLVARRVTRTLAREACLIQLVRESDGQVEWVRGHKVRDEEAFPKPYSPPTALRRVARRGEVFNLGRLEERSERWAHALLALGFHSLAGAPVQGDRGIIGVIWVAGDRPGALDVVDAAFLRSAGRQVGEAVERARVWGERRELNLQKARFAGSVARGLRSSVDLAAAGLHKLIEKLPESLTAVQREELADAESRIRHLRVLVDDTLAVAGCRAGLAEGNLERRTELRRTTAAVVSRYRRTAERRGQWLELQVDGEGPYNLAAEERQVSRIIDNLVSNAIKYTPEGGRIGVHLSGRNGEYVLAVKDSGIGIPAGSLGRIGQEHYRAPNARRLVAEGTGLGLAITSRLVAELDGRLDIASEEGRGSRFTIHFNAN